MEDREGTPKRYSKVENSVCRTYKEKHLLDLFAVKATEVGIMIVLETFCGLKLTCMGDIREGSPCESH